MENIYHNGERFDSMPLENFRGHVFVQCSFNHCVIPESVNLYGSTFYGCQMTFLEAEGAKFNHVSFHDCDLRHSNFRKTVWTQSRAHKCDFTWADFTDSDLKMLSGEGSDFKLSHIQKASKINIWDRDMVSELVRFHANGDLDMLMVAALVKVSMEFCWKEWKSLSNLPQFKKVSDVVYKVLNQYQGG